MKEFFVPLSQEVVGFLNGLHENVLGKNIAIHSQDTGFPDLESVRFALIGVKESRNDMEFHGELPDFDALRMALYSLFPGNWDTHIADLGDIEPGETVSDTYYALQNTVEQLVKQQIIPVVMGGGQDLVYPVYRGYDNFGKMINVVNVDRKFDIGNADAPITNTSYVGKMVVDQPYNLFNYSVLGYQTYFNDTNEIALLDKLYFDAVRLGEIAGQPTIVEPIIRDADLVTFDFTAIKSAERSYIGTSSPNGLDGREVCAISRYAGISNRVSAFGVFELSKLTSPTAAMLVAQIIWYFMEGVNCRVSDGDFNAEKDFTTYKVPVEDMVLVFKKSLKTERWWVELPFDAEMDNKLKSQTLLPCTYQDYENACNQEIPERWIKARRKNEV